MSVEAEAPPPPTARELLTVEATAPVGATATMTPTTPSSSVSATSSLLLLARPEKPERNLWREQEMLTVLQIIRDHNYLTLLNDKTVRSETVFRNIEKEMHDRGLRKKNYQQIWTKWKFLKSTYMTSRRMHIIPKIIPLDVYESLDELLNAEFRNDGSVSSYDGGDYEESGANSYEMNASASSSSLINTMIPASVAAAAAGGNSNDGGLLVISNVQGGVVYSNKNGLQNGGRRHFAELNGGFGVVGSGSGKKKLKNGIRSVLKTEEDTNGFGMQHPIFGYRLGVVKDEPIDDDYPDSCHNNSEDPFSDVHLDEPSNSQQFPEVKTELLSPPHSPLQHDIHEDLPPVPVMQLPTIQDIPSLPQMILNSSLTESQMPPLHRYTPPPYSLPHQPELPLHPPPLKQMPLVKITLPPKPEINSPVLRSQHQSAPIPATVNSKKIPVLTIRKRKKRLNIPQLSEGTDSTAPSSKRSKICEEDDTKESHPDATRISFVTYGKAIREMSNSLREIQREMIDEFFKQQMDMAKSEHEFQKQQDALLLRCFEDQTKMLLEGAKKLFTANMPANVVYINDQP